MWMYVSNDGLRLRSALVVMATGSCSNASELKEATEARLAAQSGKTIKS